MSLSVGLASSLAQISYLLRNLAQQNAFLRPVMARNHLTAGGRQANRATVRENRNKRRREIRARRAAEKAKELAAEVAADNKTATSQKPQTFPLFPHLPYELRALIWASCLTHNPPRLLRLNMGQYRCKYARSHHIPNNPTNIHVLPTFHSESRTHDTRAYCRTLPITLRVSQESRRETLRCYRPFGATVIGPRDVCVVRFKSSVLWKERTPAPHWNFNRSGQKQRFKVYPDEDEPVVEPEDFKFVRTIVGAKQVAWGLAAYCDEVLQARLCGREGRRRGGNRVAMGHGVFSNLEKIVVVHCDRSTYTPFVNGAGCMREAKVWPLSVANRKSMMALHSWKLLRDFWEDVVARNEGMKDVVLEPGRLVPV